MCIDSCEIQFETNASYCRNAFIRPTFISANYWCHNWRSCFWIFQISLFIAEHLYNFIQLFSCKLLGNLVWLPSIFVFLHIICIIISSPLFDAAKNMKFSFSLVIFKWESDTMTSNIAHFCCLLLWLLIFWANIFTLYVLFTLLMCLWKKQVPLVMVVVVVIVIISHLFSLVSLEPSNLGNTSNQQPHSTAYYFLSFLRLFIWCRIALGLCIMLSSLVTLCVWRKAIRSHHTPIETFQ